MASSTIPNSKTRDLIRGLRVDQKQNRAQAIGGIALSTTLLAASILIYVAGTRWMSPFGILVGGIGLTGYWILAHECVHRNLFESHQMNRIAGYLLSLPTLYPFSPMADLHLRHHAFVNDLEHDTTWTPLTVEHYERSSRTFRFFYRCYRTWVWWLAPVAHVFTHFIDHSSKRREFFLSRASVVLFAAAFVLIVSANALLYACAAWFVFSFFLSSISALQHTGPEIEWSRSNSAPAVSVVSQDLDFPKWLARLFHNANVHSVHHLNPRIPFYNTPRALRKISRGSAGKPIKTFKSFLFRCHLYDQKRNRFVSFSERTESPRI